MFEVIYAYMVTMVFSICMQARRYMVYLPFIVIFLLLGVSVYLHAHPIHSVLLASSGTQTDPGIGDN